MGGDAQLPAYRNLVGPLKLFFSQFEELESFAKFGTQMDEETAQQLRRGRAIRSVMQQIQYTPMPVETQIAIFSAVNAGLFDFIKPTQIAIAQSIIDKVLHQRFEKVIHQIVDKREKLDEKITNELLKAFQTAFKKEKVIFEP